MTSNELRQKYLDFFRSKNHDVISSASLIPENDSTLLFTNSGMSPLIPYLLGEKHPAGGRLVNSQKCFRTEDIEEVGDSRHNTFFEMLGNWSLGDYFKKEQLTWWFEFIFSELKLDPTKIYQTVYAGSADGKIKEDEETITILQDLFKKYGVTNGVGAVTIGLGELGSGQEVNFTQQRIFPYRDKNWWKRGDAIGELGGPDSETFYDTGQVHDPKFGKYCQVNCDCGRFLEIGNSVFMQYKKTAAGWEELKNKNVDFGGGLERILAVVNKENNIFKTDLFNSVIVKIEELSGKKYSDRQAAFEIIADHLKAATFITGDDKGVSPSNTDQGYIVRRLIRRAIRYGRQLEINQLSWIKTVAAVIIYNYKQTYPELSRKQDFIFTEFEKEEAKFNRTLEQGLKELDKVISNRENLTGHDLFTLYQSSGFPLELSLEELAQRQLFITAEEKLKLSQEFRVELKKHQDLSRTASAGKFKGGLADASEETTKLHTAAHLLLSALRQVFGDQVVQKGSNITPERLRLDFLHSEKMTPEQIKAVEDLVNGAIKADYKVICEELTLEEAKNRGAMGVFTSKYGERVKVYTITYLDSAGLPDIKQAFSQEICGGPHVAATGLMGHFKIQKEEASSSGVRRIKAVLEK